VRVYVHIYIYGRYWGRRLHSVVVENIIYSIICTPIYITTHAVDGAAAVVVVVVEEQTNQRQNCFRIYRDRSGPRDFRSNSSPGTTNPSHTHALLYIHNTPNTITIISYYMLCYIGLLYNIRGFVCLHIVVVVVVVVSEYVMAFRARASPFDVTCV